MIVFLKSDGTVAFHDSENINMGSNNANHITLVAPFPASSVVTVAFRLPNGKTLGPQLVTDSATDFNMTSIGAIPGYVVEGATLNAWSYKINSTLTGIMGTLTVQMFITSNDGTTLATVSVNANINSGAPNVALPEHPDGNIYGQILSYLSTRYTASQLVDLAKAWAQGSSEDLSNAGAPAGSKSSKGWADTASDLVDLAEAWAQGSSEDLSNAGAPVGSKSSKGWADTSQQWAESDTYDDPEEGEKTLEELYAPGWTQDRFGEPIPDLEDSVDYMIKIENGSAKFFAIDAFVSYYMADKSLDEANAAADRAEAMKWYKHSLAIKGSDSGGSFEAYLILYSSSLAPITSLNEEIRNNMHVSTLKEKGQRRLPTGYVSKYRTAIDIQYVGAFSVDDNNEIYISTKIARFNTDNITVTDTVTEVKI